MITAGLSNPVSEFQVCGTQVIEGRVPLVVGHSPTNEAAVSGAGRPDFPAMGKGEGVLVVEDGGRYELRPF